MASTSSKVGRAVAKGLGIRVDYRDDATEELTRGESVFSVSSTDAFIEEEPTAAEWFRQVSPNGQTVKHYFKELFPFLGWIFHYNLIWFYGDLIAGEWQYPSPLISLAQSHSPSLGRR